MVRFNNSVSSRSSQITNRGAVGKLEQTSQTYGQFIQIVESEIGISGRSTTGTTNRLSNAATDTTVKVVRSDNDAGNLTLTDEDKARIAVAAVTSPEPTVAVNMGNLGGSRGIIAGDIDLARNVSTNFSDVVQNLPGESVVVAGSVYIEPQKVKEILTEAKKIDLMLTLKSKDSEVLEFNNLKELQLDSEFTYNFFNNFEADIESQEDPSQDPYLKTSLINVPKYVKLTWKPVEITEPLSIEETTHGTEVDTLKIETFQTPRVEGEQLPPINREGRKIELIDMHKLEQAVESTSNRKVFGNSISATLHVQRGRNVVNDIPVQRSNLNLVTRGRALVDEPRDLQDEKKTESRTFQTERSSGRGDL